MYFLGLSHAIVLLKKWGVFSWGYNFSNIGVQITAKLCIEQLFLKIFKLVNCCQPSNENI